MSFYLKNTQTDALVNKVLENLIQDRSFQKTLENENISNRIKEMLNETLINAEVSQETLKSPDFKKKLLLACIALKMAALAEQNPKLKIKFNEIFKKFDWKLLFKDRKEMSEEEKAEHDKNLRLIFTDILTEQNKLAPDKNRLSKEQIDELVDKIMENDNPEDELLKLLDEMAKLQEQEKEKLELEEAEEQREYEEEEERESARVEGVSPKGILALGMITTAIAGNPKQYPLTAPAVTESSIKSKEKIEIQEHELHEKMEITSSAIEQFKHMEDHKLTRN